MGELDALGDAVAGAMMGRAVEPAAGEAGDGHTNERACLNCGAALTGPYCHECGQQAHVHRTLGAFLHDFLHGVLHFEGKIWRTLPLLAWKPGQLTRSYIDGQRARFVSPVALFLFSVFLMFAVIGLTGNSKTNFNGTRDLAAQQHSAQAELTRLQARRAKLAASKAPTVEVDEKIGETRDEIALIKTMRDKGVTSAVLDSGQTNFQTELPWLKQAWYKARENPDLLLYKVKTNSYKWSWAIIPLSAPFVWLLFPFSRRFRFYDHVVFVTYSLSFMTLMVSAGVLLAAIGFGTAAPFMLLIPPVHIYRQLRGAYGVGRAGALWRTALLLLFAAIVLAAFVVGMGALGLYD